MKLEICANGISSALIAQEAGADRIELCTALEVGGLTPSIASLELVREQITLPTHVLVRPRPGHFMYDPQEVDIMVNDIRHIRELGFQGIVFGALNRDRSLDQLALTKMVDAAGDMSVVFHRAMDWVVNPMQALAKMIELGFTTVLSSGQAKNAIDGLNNLEQWHKEYGSQIDIMPGAGINSSHIPKFKAIGFNWIHASASSKRSLSGISNKLSFEENGFETSIRETDQAIVKELIKAIGSA